MMFVVFSIFILMITGVHSIFAEKSIFSDWIGSFTKLGVAEVLLEQEFENTKIKNYQQELNYISVKNKVIQEEIQYLRAENKEYRTLITLLKNNEKTTNEINSVIYDDIHDDIHATKNIKNTSSYSSSISHEFADVRIGASSSIQKTDNLKLDKYFLYVESIPASATNIENTVLSAVKFWESRADVKFEIVDSINDANLILKFVQELPGTYAGFVFNGKLVKIGLGDSNCNGNWHPLDE